MCPVDDNRNAEKCLLVTGEQLADAASATTRAGKLAFVGGAIAAVSLFNQGCAATKTAQVKQNVAAQKTPGYTLEQVKRELDTGDEQVFWEWAKKGKQDHDVFRLLAAHPRTPMSILATYIGSNRTDILQILSDQRCEPIVLEKLGVDYEFERIFVKYKSEMDKALVGIADDCKQEDYQALADSRATLLRARAAEYTTDPAVLEKLSGDESREVLLAVVENPHAPKKILKKLAQSEDSQVLLAVIERPELSADLFELIVNHSDSPKVLEVIRKKYDAVPETIRSAAYYKRKNLMQQLPKNPDAPSELLDEVLEATDNDDTELRKLIAEHPNLSMKGFKYFLVLDNRRFMQSNGTLDQDERDHYLKLMLHNGNPKICSKAREKLKSLQKGRAMAGRSSGERGASPAGIIGCSGCTSCISCTGCTFCTSYTGGTNQFCVSAT